MRRAPHVLFCLAVTLFGPAMLSAAPPDPSPYELIALYSEYLNTFDKAAFSITERLDATGTQIGSKGWHSERKYRIWCDGARWKEAESYETRFERGGKPIVSRQAGERIYPGKGRLTVGYDATGKKADGIVAFLDELPDEERAYAGLASFSPLVNGKMFGNSLALPDVMRRSHLSVRKQRLEDHDFWVVEGTGDWGYHAIWLDPARSGMPSRIVQRKEPQHRFMQFKLGLIPSDQGGPKKRWEQQLDVTSTNKLQGRDIPAGFVLVTEREAASGDKLVQRFVASFDHIELNPDFSANPFRPSVAISDGCPVTVEGQEHIDYEWRDGKIVKKVNDGTLVGLARHWFQRGSVIGNSVVLLVLASVIGLGVYLWCRRRPVVPH